MAAAAVVTWVGVTAVGADAASVEAVAACGRGRDGSSVTVIASSHSSALCH